LLMAMVDLSSTTGLTKSISNVDSLDTIYLFYRRI